jgi:hypothetical protein
MDEKRVSSRRPSSSPRSPRSQKSYKPYHTDNRNELLDGEGKSSVCERPALPSAAQDLCRTHSFPSPRQARTSRRCLDGQSGGQSGTAMMRVFLHFDIVPVRSMTPKVAGRRTRRPGVADPQILRPRTTSTALP